MITLEPDVARALGVRPSVSAVIFDRRGHLLLPQRSDGGQWGLPGGSVEIGESITEAVRREVHEETGLDVTVRGGELTTCDETLDLRYFSLRRLPTTLLPNHRVRIRDARIQRTAAFIR